MPGIPPEIEKTPDLLMLHGATMDMAMFVPQISALQDRFRVLRIDLPEHGGSAGKKFSVQNCVDGVLEILDREEVQSCHLVGQSLGGIVCQLLAKQRPGLALSLTLIGSVPLSAPLYRLKAPAFWLVTRLKGALPLNLSRSLVTVSAGTLPQTRADIEKCLGKFEKTALMEIVHEVGQALNSDSYPVPDCPVLIIYGTQDWIASGLNRFLAKRWASLLRINAHSIPGASHNANMDQPDAVNELILEHLKVRTKAET